MSQQVNRQWVLKSRPAGWPEPSNFELRQSPIPEPGVGEVLVRSQYLSVDPYMRGRMRDRRGYAEPVHIGEVMVGGGVGRIIQSRHPKWREGTIVVTDAFGWQDYTVSDGKGLWPVDPELAPVSASLGVLGMPGLTAYFGLLDICEPEPGQTVFVSGAAGAVGSTVGQIARIIGCRAVGSAGTDEKVAWLTGELGFAGAFNYKTVDSLGQALDRACPNGIDRYFDNVGGPITDAVFPRLNLRARVAVCGQISIYNAESAPQGPRLLWYLIGKRARVEGFLIFDYAKRYREGLEKLVEWVNSGQLIIRETVVEGLENMPEAFIGMMRGANIGKMVVEVGGT